MKKNFVIIALGSNLGGKEKNLLESLRRLKSVMEIEACSNIYSSSALLPEGAPKTWDNDFYNCALWGYTLLQPMELLDFCHKTEEAVCETARSKGTWAPRMLDIDIIAYNDEIVNEDKLQIPHPRMIERSFVLKPISDILPGWEHPLNGKTAKMMLDSIKDDLGLKKLDIKLL